MQKLVRGVVALVGVGLSQWGCSAQADPNYQGESLATVRGTVITTDAPPSGDIDAALLWLPEAPMVDPSLKLASALVRGSFPAAFTLDVLAPPPPGSIPESSGARYGVIAAIKHQSGSSVPPSAIVGVVVDAGVVYFPEDSKSPGDYTAQEAARVNVPPTRGYHLFRILVTEETEGASVRCEYDGVCDRDVITGGDGFREYTPEELAAAQAMEDQRFALCTKYLPDAPRCDITYDNGRHPEVHPEEAACFALTEARADRKSRLTGPDSLCPTAWTYPANPEEFEHPVTIALGATLEDVLHPTTLWFRDQTSE
jgi:hypothetical protein